METGQTSEIIGDVHCAADVHCDYIVDMHCAVDVHCDCMITYVCPYMTQ